MLSLLKSLHRSSLSYCGAPRTVSWQTCPPRLCRTCMWMHHHCSACCTRTLTAPKPPRRCRGWSRLRPPQRLSLRRRPMSSRSAAAQHCLYILLYTYYTSMHIFIRVTIRRRMAGSAGSPSKDASEVTVCQYSTCVGASSPHIQPKVVCMNDMSSSVT